MQEVNLSLARSSRRGQMLDNYTPQSILMTNLVLANATAPFQLFRPLNNWAWTCQFLSVPLVGGALKGKPRGHHSFRALPDFYLLKSPGISTPFAWQRETNKNNLKPVSAIWVSTKNISQTDGSRAGHVPSSPGAR